MPKTVAYKSYTAKTRNSQDAAVVPAARRNVGRVGIYMIIAGLVLAIGSVLVVPLLVGGAPPSASMQQEMEQRDVVHYESPQDVLQVLSLDAALPQALPEGYAVTSSAVVDGAMLEAEISNGKNVILFRTAAGSEDLSGEDYDAFAYTGTETVDGTARGYAGYSDKKLALAVWATGDCTYALVSKDGVEAATMKAIAESIR